ncbi:MAG: hypothetical protein SFU98_01840 [Leptospiraceae bacterium]|nr:hypothetical protein [Leptospiraceae bacterium]
MIRLDLKNLFFVLISLIFLFNPIFSEKKSSQFPTQPISLGSNIFATSGSLDASNNEFHLASVPFNYPFELSLAPGYVQPKDTIGMEILQQRFYHNFLFSKNISQESSVQLVSYSVNQLSEIGTIVRDSNPRLPEQNAQSFFMNRNQGLVFIFHKKDFGINMDLSFRISTNLAGASVLDTAISSVGVYYSLDRFTKQPVKINMNLQQLQEVAGYSSWEDRIKKPESRFTRSLFLSPGFTVGSKNVMLEGLIRMPLPHTGSPYESDFLGKPEIQGRLGLKWILPEMMQP